MTQKLYDINTLPSQEGILVFPISMSNISTSQSGKKCYECMKHFSPKKIVMPAVGLNFIYGDYLYLSSDKKSHKLKNKFAELMVSHKNSFLNLLNKETTGPRYVLKAFSFTTWGQLYLECKGSFTEYLNKARKKYRNDFNFQECIAQDCMDLKRPINKDQINFFIEEIVMSYLILKGVVKLQNDFIQHQEKWILWCYPGKPLKSRIYFFQKNLLGLKNPGNRYENSFYDMRDNVFYDFDKISLDN